MPRGIAPTSMRLRTLPVTGSRVKSYARTTGDSTTGSASMILDITSGDKIRIRAQRVAGSVSNIQTEANKSRLTVVEL